MSAASAEPAVPEISSPGRLAAWMDSAGLAPGAPLAARYISGGSQNEIYEVTRGDDFRAVLRIPPARANAERDNGIAREYKIIEALDGTDVPHTPAIALCEDASVLGRAFYLMGFVDGWSPMELAATDGPRRWPEPFNSDVEQRRGPWPSSSSRASRCCRGWTGRPAASRA